MCAACIATRSFHFFDRVKVTGHHNYGLYIHTYACVHEIVEVQLWNASPMFALVTSRNFPLSVASLVHLTIDCFSFIVFFTPFGFDRSHTTPPHTWAFNFTVDRCARTRHKIRFKQIKITCNLQPKRNYRVFRMHAFPSVWVKCVLLR